MEATTLASGGALRSGRKMRKWRMRPSRMAKISEISIAGQNCMLGPKLMRVGQSGRSNVSVSWNQWTTPSMGANGLGSGGRNRSPSLRSTA